MKTWVVEKCKQDVCPDHFIAWLRAVNGRAKANFALQKLELVPQKDQGENKKKILQKEIAAFDKHMQHMRRAYEKYEATQLSS
jgi:hypothetical protein